MFLELFGFPSTQFVQRKQKVSFAPPKSELDPLIYLFSANLNSYGCRFKIFSFFYVLLRLHCFSLLLMLMIINTIFCRHTTQKSRKDLRTQGLTFRKTRTELGRIIIVLMSLLTSALVLMLVIIL